MTSTLGWKLLKVTNTLAYYNTELIAAVSFHSTLATVFAFAFAQIKIV